MYILTFLYFLIVSKVSGAPATYDQRQTGDVNVQIHLKDVQVVALVDTEFLEDYTDYNYSYDYSDFTIKPIIKPSTSSGSSTTASAWYTWPTNSPNSMTTVPPETSKNSTSSALIVNSTEIISTTTGTPDEEIIKIGSQKLCQSGYHKDAKGRCRKGLRRKFSFFPIALRMLPKRSEIQQKP